MTTRWRLLWLVGVANVALLLPAVLLPASEYDTAGGLISLGALAIVFVSYARGITAGVIASATLGAVSAISVAGAPSVVAGIAVMTLAALAQGVAARAGLDRITLLVPITLAFVVSEPPTSGPLASPIAFGLALTAFGAFVAIAVATVQRGAPPESAAMSIAPARAGAYALLLALTTVATSAIALSGAWGHAGGWLVMTPFIVIQPYVQDGWRKALGRALGTVVGFGIAFGLAEAVGSAVVLTILGWGFATVAIIAMARKWPYALYASLLTPAIILLESGGRSVVQMADRRLVATLVGVALSMTAMAIAIPVYRSQARTLGLDRY